jgi:heterodisulfide reductase subunit C
MVWRQGTAQWVVASDVKDLFPAPAGIAGPAVTPPSSSPLARATRELMSRQQMLAEAQVVPDAGRCVQCGICSYNCPIEIDVRAHAWRGRPIRDSHCLTCGECVKRCPRGVLAFEAIPLLKAT